jgi:RimJ/RimL family protein N-acetyltransferase
MALMLGPVLAGERIRLEPPRLEYAPAYVRWFGDQVVTRFLIVRNPTTLARQQAWIERMAGSRDDVLWAMVRATDGGLIGNLGLHKIGWRQRNAEMGYVIGERDQWGKGYATEAVELATAFGFVELGLHKMYATVVAGNEASRRALEKNGYRQCGLYKKHRYVEGQWRDLWVGEILKDEWNSAR